MCMACTLSQWELDEMAYLSRCGWSRASLASWYHMSVRNVDRLLRKMDERGGDARGEVRDAVAGQQVTNR